jgi:hypothetical protein
VETGLCNPFVSNGSVNTFPRIGTCYEGGDVIKNGDDVIKNGDGVFRGVCAEYLREGDGRVSSRAATSQS